MENILGPPFWFWRLLLAAVLAGVIGFERQLRGCAAGLRTELVNRLSGLPGVRHVAWKRLP